MVSVVIGMKGSGAGLPNACMNEYTKYSESVALGLCIKLDANLCITLSLSSYVSGPGGHVSKYSIQWLAENSYEATKKRVVQPRILWNADIYKKAKIPSAKWDTLMSSDDELKTFLQNYLHYGIAFVDGVPATVEATEEVAQRVSLVR